MGVIGRVTGVTDHFERTEEFADSVISSPAATPIITLYTRLGIALLAVQRGDVSAAEEQYAALLPIPNALTAYATVNRVLGLLAHTSDQLDRAMAHFEEGLAFCRKNGCRPELAWTCCDYADTLLQRDDSGDRAQAMSLLDEGLVISSELGMRALMERIEGRKDILKK